MTITLGVHVIIMIVIAALMLGGSVGVLTMGVVQINRINKVTTHFQNETSQKESVL